MLGANKRSIMTRAGKVLLVCRAFLLSSCLLPPPIDEAEPTVNHWPRIDPESLTPAPTDGPKVMTTRCASYSFFATLDDPDSTDTIYWRIFLDYYRQAVPVLLVTPVAEANPGQQITFDVSPNDPRFFSAGSLAEVHMVELFIADRPFITDGRRPYARAVPAGAWTDSFVWTVDLNNQDPCIGTAAP